MIVYMKTLMKMKPNMNQSPQITTYVCAAVIVKSVGIVVINVAAQCENVGSNIS